jgi:glutathione synthase/RimK-type ligase-like ATP-grasp enzyme
MIAIVSEENDVHAQAVMSELESQGASYSLINFSKYPAHSSLTINFDANEDKSNAQWREHEKLLNFNDFKVVWWRRPQQFQIHPDVLRAEDINFAFREAESALSGLWLTLDAFWINHPNLTEVAGRKVYQLKIAQNVGLHIPKTRITNNVEDAKAFIKTLGTENTVYKAFLGTEKTWRETRVLKPNELDFISNVQYTPVIFQEYIPAGVDFRITIVGDQIFPAAIHSRGTEYEIDFRMVMGSAKIKEATLPKAVTKSLFALMKKLDLTYGAIDMRQTPDGEFIFLEINPAGQWLFIEEATGQPIAKALAELMISKDKDH